MAAPTQPTPRPARSTRGCEVPRKLNEKRRKPTISGAEAANMTRCQSSLRASVGESYTIARPRQMTATAAAATPSQRCARSLPRSRHNQRWAPAASTATTANSSCSTEATLTHGKSARQRGCLRTLEFHPMGLAPWVCAALAAAAAARVFLGYPPAPGFRRLARREVALLTAAGDALFPPGGALPPSASEARVAERLDDYLALVPAQLRLLMRLLLFLLEHATLVFPAPGPRGWRRFSSLS